MGAVARGAPAAPARVRRVPGAARAGGVGRFPVGAGFPARHEAIDRNADVAAVADAALADDINQSACALGRRVVARCARSSDGPGAGGAPNARAGTGVSGKWRQGKTDARYELTTRVHDVAYAPSDTVTSALSYSIDCCHHGRPPAPFASLATPRRVWSHDARLDRRASRARRRAFPRAFARSPRSRRVASFPEAALSSSSSDLDDAPPVAPRAPPRAPRRRRRARRPPRVHIHPSPALALADAPPPPPTSRRSSARLVSSSLPLGMGPRDGSPRRDKGETLALVGNFKDIDTVSVRREPMILHADFAAAADAFDAADAAAADASARAVADALTAAERAAVDANQDFGVVGGWRTESPG